jgi:hypothetical protein
MVQLFLEQRVIYERMLGNSHKLVDPERDEAAISAYIKQCADKFMTIFDVRINELRFGEKKVGLEKPMWRAVSFWYVTEDLC